MIIISSEGGAQVRVKQIYQLMSQSESCTVQCFV